MNGIMEVIASTVIFLFSAGNNPQPIGTGFIVGYPMPDKEGKVIPLVVTAKHVIGDHRLVLARFSTQEGGSTAFVQYDMDAMKKSNDYWEYPGDDGVDIVVFRSPHFEITKYTPFPVDMIATKKMFEDDAIRQTDRVIFPSLLVNFLGSAKNYPVIRDGSIALIPSEKVPMKYKVGSREIITEQEVILVDATSIPGASGSPVFLWPGPRQKGNSYQMGGTKPYLLGIMHGFYPAVPREILEVQTSDTKKMYSENSGVAIIFPSWKLRDIFESGAFKNRMQEIVRMEDNRK
jgi:hypothetical protein